MRCTPPRTLCWLLTFLLLFEWSGVLGWGLARGQSANQTRLALPSPAELAKAGAIPPPARKPLPEGLLTQLEALYRAIPDVRYDIAARARTLGAGAEPAFRFVRDQISFEAYPGVLRGAEGTYVTRAGNAFDRSLVLAELLRGKGVRTRFAMGRLPRPQAERLFGRIFETPRPLEADAVNAPLPSYSVDAAAFSARLRARALRDYAVIRKALGNTLPSRGSPSREDVLREIEQHIWVQAEVNGRWVDIDSAFADAVPGRTYATAERTVEVLPKEAYQRVTIRVISETLASGSLKTETALEFSTTAEELLDRQVFLTHTPGGGGGLAGAIAGAATGGGDVWTPMLWVDGGVHLGKPIAFSEQAKPAERGRPPGGGLGGLFGAGGALSAPSQFVAEWLQVELAFPDGRREVTQRALIDRAGMAWRQSGKPDAAALRPLARDADGLTAPRALNNIWFSAGRHNLSHYTGALWQLAQWVKEVALQGRDASKGAGAPSSTPPNFGEQVWPLAVTNFALLVQSDHAVVPALNDSALYRFYADSPRIMVVSIGLDGSGGRHVQYDLRRDRLRGIARDASPEAGLVERKVWFGVLQGALEHEMAVEHAVAGGADSAKVISTSGLLADEGAVGLRPTDAARVSGLFASKETAARAARALAGGNVLVVSKPILRGGPLAWWHIAPDGETRAVLGEDANGVEWPAPTKYPGSGGLGDIDYPIPKDWVGNPNPPGGGPTGGGGTGGGAIPQDPIPGGGARPPGPPPRPGTIPQDPLPGGGARPPGSPPTTGPATAKPAPGGWDPSKYPQHDNPMKPGGTKDECRKRGSLSTPAIRVAMASPLPSGLIQGHGRESVHPPLLLATATESTLVTNCVAVPAVGVAGIAMAIVALGFLGIAAAALGYLIGSNL